MKVRIHQLREHAYIPLALAIGALVWWKMNDAPTQPEPTTKSSAILSKPRFDEKNTESQAYVRDDVLTSLGFSEEQNIQARVAVTKSLSDDLSLQELEVLIQFLLERRSASINEGDHAYFFHELCNKLHHFPVIRKTFAETLYQVALDTRQDAITRDYAMQHLRRVWDKSQDISELQDSIQSSFWNLVEKEPATSASALLSLHTLGMNTSPNADFSDADVSTHLFLPHLQSIFSHSPNLDSIAQRMTAVRIVGARKIDSLSPQLIAMIEDENEHMLVRTAAISALSKLDQKEQLVSLSSKYAQNHRLSQALQHAIR